MKIVLAGGTGFVGRSLCNHFYSRGYDVVILTRNPNKQTDERFTYVEWLTKKEVNMEPLHGADVIINLAGESINNRWTSAMKKQILQSRIQATEALHQLIQRLPENPKVYVQASAIGFYGTSDSKAFTEKHEQAGDDFLAHVVSQWEEAGQRIEKEGIRTVYMRFGLILERTEGALPLIALPYKLFVGGTIGRGTQWISWAHIEDVCKIIEFVIEHEKINGPVNVTAPHPVEMKVFGKTLAKILRRPHWLPVPAFALNILLGEMSMLITEGQRVLPEKALHHGFQFQYNHVREALEQLYD